MKRRLLRHKPVLWSLIAALILASCSQDELAEQGTALPDGIYPMTFTAVQVTPESTPQTRVSESATGVSSKWDGGEVIKVTVSGTGNDMETDCTLDGSGNITAYNPQLYWQNTSNATINAWYSNITGQGTVTENTVSLDNQSGGLAYVLKIEKPVTANYQTGDIVLNFYHQLAKIRVKLDKGSYQGDLSNATVKVKGYTSCIVKNGEVSEGSGEGYITMHKNGDWYEANLVPGTLQASEAFKIISADGKTAKVNLNNDVSLEKGKVHTITITVNAEGPEEITGGQTITKPGDYIMKGTITESVTLSGDGITLTLDGISSTANNAIHIMGGNPTLVVKGTSNSFSCSDTPILLAPDANVTIKGSTDEPTDSKLTIRTSTDKVAGIGSASDSSCGNISIANVTLDVHGGTGDYGGAAIGTNGSFGSSCGNITIENSIVYAKGGTGASAIGLGTGSDSKSCGEIKIIRSKIFATTTYDNYYKCYAACIGHGAYAERTPVSVGKITITTNETQEDFFGTDRFKALDVNGNEVTTGFYKVGKCTNSEYQSKQTWQGVTFNEKKLADGNSNGYQ